MPNLQHDKSRSRITVEIIEFNPDSALHKTVIKKHSGAVNTSSVDTRTAFDEQISAYENFLQVVEGKARVTVNGTSRDFKPGQGISVPAKQPYSIFSEERFKMILTILRPE